MIAATATHLLPFLGLVLATTAAVLFIVRATGMFQMPGRNDNTTLPADIAPILAELRQEIEAQTKSWQLLLQHERAQNEEYAAGNGKLVAELTASREQSAAAREEALAARWEDRAEKFIATLQKGNRYQGNRDMSADQPERTV